MEYYTERHQAMSRVFRASSYTWSRSGKRLVIYGDGDRPLGVFRVKIVARIDTDKKWIWCWDDKNNFMEKDFYPSHLRAYLDDAIIVSDDTFLKTIASLTALQGQWYVYLDDKNGTRLVVILTHICKLYIHA